MIQMKTALRTDKLGLRWNLGLFAVGKGGEGVGYVTGKGEAGRRAACVGG